MKTFVRLIRRYVLAAVGIVLLLVFLGLGLLVFLGWQETTHLPQRTYASSEIADAMVETPAGLALGAAHTPEEWMDGYAWAMVLDDTGHIRWSYALPDALNHAYTTGEVAGFARWYLDDYPVFCWAEDYGLFVIGLARGSLLKYSIYTSPEYILNLAKPIPLGFGLLLLLAAICCFLLSWQGAKRLETVASGLDALAEGQTVQLPTEGFAGELAEKLNQTSAQLQTRNELLARRDDARTQWIAGVSHDVRTPLALILGWAEQLERDAVLPETARQKAGGIRTQSDRFDHVRRGANRASGDKRDIVSDTFIPKPLIYCGEGEFHRDADVIAYPGRRCACAAAETVDGDDVGAASGDAAGDRRDIVNGCDFYDDRFFVLCSFLQGKYQLPQVFDGIDIVMRRR